MSEVGKIHYKETQFGLEYGAAMVERTLNHKGYVIITVYSLGNKLEIEVSPKGRSIKTRSYKCKP